MSKWNKDSWRDYNILQQPVYPDITKLRECEDKLSKLPPLVFAGEVRNLKDELAKVTQGHGFLLQGGDCAGRRGQDRVRAGA